MRASGVFGTFTTDTGLLALGWRGCLSVVSMRLACGRTRAGSSIALRNPFALLAVAVECRTPVLRPSVGRAPADTPLMRQYLDLKEQHPDAMRLLPARRLLRDVLRGRGRRRARARPDADLARQGQGRRGADVRRAAPRGARLPRAAHRARPQGRRSASRSRIRSSRRASSSARSSASITPGVVLDDEVLDPKLPRYVVGARAGGDRLGETDALAGLAYLDAPPASSRPPSCRVDARVIDELVRVGAARGRSSRRSCSANGARPQLAASCARASSRVRVERGADSARGRRRERELGALGRRRARSSRCRIATLAIRAAARGASAYARATQPDGHAADRAARSSIDAGRDAVVARRGGDREPRADRDADRPAQREGSLLDVIDETVTAPGARLLRRWLLYPLVDVAQIRRRQDAVAWLVERPALLRAIRRALARIADLERLAGKATLGVATPRDLGRLRDALAPAAGARRARARPAQRRSSSAPLPPSCSISRAVRATTALAALAARLRTALVDEPPPCSKDGDVIRARLRRDRRRVPAPRRRRQGRHPRDRGARAEGQRHREPQGPLQPRLRLLHRGHEDAPREGARRTTSASRRSRRASATSRPSSPSSRRRS